MEVGRTSIPCDGTAAAASLLCCENVNGSISRPRYGLTLCSYPHTSSTTCATGAHLFSAARAETKRKEAAKAVGAHIPGIERRGKQVTRTEDISVEGAVGVEAKDVEDSQASGTMMLSSEYIGHAGRVVYIDSETSADESQEQLLLEYERGQERGVTHNRRILQLLTRSIAFNREKGDEEAGIVGLGPLLTLKGLSLPDALAEVAKQTPSIQRTLEAIRLSDDLTVLCAKVGRLVLACL